MSYDNPNPRTKELVERIGALRAELREVQKAARPEPIRDYQLQGADGPVTLSELFGDKRDLFVIHNMGTSCVYCTVWADGFNGVLPHLESRAAFVVSSPDAPETQAKFARSRGWRFRMVSHKGTSFAADMGYLVDGHCMPGVSVLQKRDGGIVRVSDTPFGPGDDYCAVFNLFDLLPEGMDDWEPRFKYG